MTIERALKALLQIKTYCSASNLDELEFVIQILEKMKNDGVDDPLHIDFTKLK